MMTATEMESIATGTGLIDRSNRVRLEIDGPDRAKFLHNLTTNEIKRLAAGRGCEAFVTSPQGKTIGYVIVLADDDRMIVRADAGGDILFLPHLRKYGVFDDVTIDDLGSSTFELHLFGPEAEEVVRRAAGRLPEAVEYAHIVAEIAGHAVRIVRESPGGLAGLTVIGDHSAADAVKKSAFELGGDLGLLEVDVESFEVLRIEAGTPVYGHEVTDKNLPQELARDDRAISFIKGCYLGQETVARIDAVGHVNQVLRGLSIEPGASVPPPGSAIEHEGKRVGTVTSAAFSPLRNSALALALIRTTHSRPGTVLTVKSVEAERSASATVRDLSGSVPRE